MQDHLIPTEMEKTIGESSHKSGIGFVSSFCIIGIINIVVGKSLQMIWDTLEIIQYIYFLKYANVLLPYMLDNILEFFNFTANFNAKFF